MPKRSSKKLSRDANAIPVATPPPAHAPAQVSDTDGSDKPIVVSELELDGWGAKYRPPQSWFAQSEEELF